MEQEYREVDQDVKYNQHVFDKDAMKKISLMNRNAGTDDDENAQSTKQSPVKTLPIDKLVNRYREVAAYMQGNGPDKYITRKQILEK